MLAILLTTSAFAQETPPAAPIPVENAPKPEEKKEEIVTLSPFQVQTGQDKGYFAENTLAGSRLNSNIADLASSITVVTKQQMEDTASLDLNDVFKYEANTEGSSSYTPQIIDRGTAKDAVSGYSFGNDGSSSTNATSNRIRGLGSADSSINYYSASPRVPFDVYNIGSIEISRGPNSLLFGMGSPAGVVNQNLQQAILNRDTNNVSARFDALGSYRGSVAFNRVLIPDKLAIHVAALYDNQQFERQPSYDLKRRQYGALTFKPFKKTTIRGFAENFINNANRPNFLTPRDFVTPWLQAGRPAYDPIARTVTRLDTNQTYGPYTLSTLSPGYVAGVPASAAALTATTSPFYVAGITFADISRPVMRIDEGNLVDWFQRQPVLVPAGFSNPQVNPTPANQGWVPQDPRYAILDRQWTSSNGLPTPAGYSSYQYAGVTNKAIYDYTKYNTNQANFGYLRAGNFNLEIEQEILPNLFFNAGWLRQDIDGVDNYTISQTTGATLTIDTNTKLPNGQANPYFGLPYVEDSAPDTFYSSQIVDNYRAMLAYELDFTNKDTGWVRWLGKHRFLGFVSKQEDNRSIIRQRLQITQADADGTLRYLPNNTIAGWNYTGGNLRRFYYLASPGDPQATVTQSTGFWGNKGYNGAYAGNINVYNYNTGSFQNDQVSESTVFTPAGSFKTQREIETWKVSMQSYLWQGRLVATAGLNHDDYRARITSTGQLSSDGGTVIAPSLTNTQIYGTNGLANENLVMNRWNRWDELTGDTKTYGAVLRPFQGWGAIDRRADQGSILADIVRNLGFHYNGADNFNAPSTFQTDYFGKALPKPTGEGKDYGVQVAMLNNKLVARLNWYEATNENERTSAAGTLLTRLAYGDTTLMLPWAYSVVRLRNGANPAVNNWNTDSVNFMTDAMINQAWDLLKLPRDYYTSVSAAGTQNSKSRGMELQLTYNPLPNWTMKVTGGKQFASYTNVAPQYDDWLAVRLPVWTAATATDIPDFVDGAGTSYSLRNFWQSYGYSSAARITNTDGNTNAQNYFNNTVVSQVATAKALQGAAAPNLRKWTGSFLTNYVFTEGFARGFSVGGSQRYASKAIAGYFGKVGDPTQPNTINVADTNRPIYNDADYTTDLWIGYTRKILKDKIVMKIKFNVNDVFESGGLEPIAYNFDGTPYAFRIVDPRQFILSTSFDF